MHTFIYTGQFCDFFLGIKFWQILVLFVKWTWPRIFQFFCQRFQGPWHSGVLSPWQSLFHIHPYSISLLLIGSRKWILSRWCKPWPFHPRSLEVTIRDWKGHKTPSQKGHQQNCQDYVTWKLTWHWKITIFNKKYMDSFMAGFFQPVMLVFRAGGNITCYTVALNSSLFPQIALTVGVLTSSWGVRLRRFGGFVAGGAVTQGVVGGVVWCV